MLRLHWFWRGAIATVAGTVGGRLLLVLMEVVGRDVARLLLSTHMIDTGIAFRIEENVVFFLPGAAVALSTYGILTALFGGAHRDSETRCRKCGYILRGITEPRCPECSERI